MYGKVARPPVQYGERERPEHRSIGLLIDAQVAHAPRTVPLAVSYTHLQSAIGRAGCPPAASLFGRPSELKIPRSGKKLPESEQLRRLVRVNTVGLMPAMCGVVCVRLFRRVDVLEAWAFCANSKKTGALRPQ